MNLDNASAFDVFQDEPIYIGDSMEAVYAMVDLAGDPVSGGAVEARQSGEQYTVRIKKTDWPDPNVHESLKTKNFGTLRMKQRFAEGDYWSMLCTGTVRARHEV